MAADPEDNSSALIADDVEEAFAEGLDAVVAGLGPNPALVPPLPASALSAALLDRDGEIAWAEPRFLELVGPDWNDLPAARAALGGRPVGMTYGRARDGGAVCLVLSRPSAAARWPVSIPAEALRAAGASALVAVAVSLGDQTDALASAARAFGFTPLETRVAVALVHTGSLPQAAERCAIAYETAREVIETARRKAGVARQPALVARLTTIAAQAHADPANADQVLIDAFGLSAREAGLALGLMRTGSRQDAARAVGISDALAKKHFGRVFEALGARSASDVSRIVLEAVAAALLAGAADLELPATPSLREPLRLIPRADGGMIAISDYGPARGRPLFVTHSGSATRLIPRSLTARLQAEGWRPLAIDRPGFGLTSLRADTADPWEAAARDMADALDALAIPRVDFLVRGGVYAVAGLARAFPDRVGRVVAMNPDVSTHHSHKRSGAIGLLWRANEHNPSSHEAVTRWLASQVTPSRLVALQRVLLRRSPVDLAALEHPAEQDDLRRSVGLFASGRLDGTIREHRAHTAGVECPALSDARSWHVMMGSNDPMHATADMQAFWTTRLPGATFEIVDGGGRFLHLTHTDRVLGVLAQGRIG